MEKKMDEKEKANTSETPSSNLNETHARENYTENYAIFALLLNFSREMDRKIGEKASKRARTIAQNILDALPKEHSTPEIALIFSLGLTTVIAHIIKKEAGGFENLRKEVERRKAGLMYA